MKCSLLTLSTFIDGELHGDRRAEVDAHLVGCPRCGAGAATLREEKARVAQLARVQVDGESAQLMLHQVGIASPSAIPRPVAVPPAQHLDATRASVTAPTPPWSPPVPTAHADAIEEVPVPADTFDADPDLFGDVPSAPASWDQARGSRGAAASATRAEPGVVLPSGAPPHADPQWPDRHQPAASWEADLPPPLDDSSEVGEEWNAPFAGGVDPPAVAAPPATPPAPRSAPMRAPAAAGPVGLLGRVRDAVAVRVALARRADAVDDSMQIVSGVPARRGLALPDAPRQSPPEDPVTTPPVAPSAAESVAPEHRPQPSIELSGTRGVGLTSFAARESRAGAVDEHPARPPTGPPVPPPVEEPARPGVPAEPEPWHAFAASSYPVEPAAEPALHAPPRKLGRHSRAVARERVGPGPRIAALAAAARTATAGAAGAARGAIGRLTAAGPDSRIFAGVAGIGLIFVVALLLGHGGTPARRSTATHTTPSTAAVPPQHSAAAPPATVAPTAAPVATQTFGSGASGQQVSRLRYGKQATFMRVVFDIGSVGAASAGTPRITLAFSDPRTVLVTLAGTAPSASVGNLPPGTIISSVTLLSSSASRSEYRIVLDRAATATAFFLLSPTRFVLDLH